MLRSTRVICAAVCAGVLLSGCATMHYPKSYKVDGKEVREFKELDDERALKVVVLIYNVKSGTWEGGIARSIALQEYSGLLRKRGSAYLRNSGIFEISYKKVNLRSWKDPDLIKLYQELLPKAEAYYIEAAPELTEIQNAERIIYLTAMNAVDAEMKRRENTRGILSFASRFIMGILMIALSFV